MQSVSHILSYCLMEKKSFPVLFHCYFGLPLYTVVSQPRTLLAAPGAGS
jgi:hypothetical protein